MAQPVMDITRQAHAFLGDRQLLFFLMGRFEGSIGGLQVLQQSLRPLGSLGGAALEQDEHQYKDHACQDLRGGLDQCSIRFPIRFDDTQGNPQSDYTIDRAVRPDSEDAGKLGYLHEQHKNNFAGACERKGCQDQHGGCDIESPMI